LNPVQAISAVKSSGNAQTSVRSAAGINKVLWLDFVKENAELKKNIKSN
jgi:hypothetical protein